MLVTQRIDFPTIHCRIVRLINLVCRKVRDVDVGVELRLKGRADLTQVVPEHAVEEFVGFDVGGGAEAAVGVC